MDIADWYSLLPFRRRLFATARLRPSAMARGRRVKIPSGRSMAFDVSWTLRTQRRPRRARVRFDALRACVLFESLRRRRVGMREPRRSTRALEVLHRTLVPVGGRPRGEGPEVA